MYCFQCQETSRNEGCTVVGICGKDDEVARLQDLLVYVLKGLAVVAAKAQDIGQDVQAEALYIAHSLFSTITNVNFDAEIFIARIADAQKVRDHLRVRFTSAFEEQNGHAYQGDWPDAVTWSSADVAVMKEKAQTVGVMSERNEDIRSLKELLTYGLKGIAAYADHADVLSQQDEDVFNFLIEGLAMTVKDNPSVDELLGAVMKAGETTVKAMALLDRANTDRYGHPEPTAVNIGAKNRPGILISGHDLKDLEELLEQTQGTGIDVYSHGEMLPANSYPFFKKFDHFVGNYGGAWHDQTKDFEAFNGVILLTTNCLVPPNDSYKDRLFTTGAVGFPEIPHIVDRKNGAKKDFSALIERARTCAPPTSLEEGTVMSGFARQTVLSVADKVIDAVKGGQIKKFVVMAGCDGRQQTRDYYTNLAQALPQDTVILTAGCAKYRYNKLDLGNIGGIPRVLDAGQCNDSYSLVVVANALKEAFGLENINDLPIAYDISWYEQKAVSVLLALLYLGVKGIRLGPTLPAFLSPNVAKVLVEMFGIQTIGTVEQDLAEIMAG